jgi:hypothetical protein
MNFVGRHGELALSQLQPDPRDRPMFDEPAPVGDVIESNSEAAWSLWDHWAAVEAFA